MKPYLSARQLSERYDYCMKTIRNLISEIKGEIEKGRYPHEAVLDGCGIRVSETVFIDYLANRKMLKDATAQKYVSEFFVPEGTSVVEEFNKQAKVDAIHRRKGL